MAQTGELSNRTRSASRGARLHRSAVSPHRARRGGRRGPRTVLTRHPRAVQALALAEQTTVLPRSAEALCQHRQARRAPTSNCVGARLRREFRLQRHRDRRRARRGSRGQGARTRRALRPTACGRRRAVVSSPPGGPTSIRAELPCGPGNDGGSGTVAPRRRPGICGPRHCCWEGLVWLLTEQGHDVVAVVGDSSSSLPPPNIGPTCPSWSCADAPDPRVGGLRQRWRSARTDHARSRLVRYVEMSLRNNLLADRRGAMRYLLPDRVARIAEFLDALNRVAGGGTVLG